MNESCIICGKPMKASPRPNVILIEELSNVCLDCMNKPKRHITLPEIVALQKWANEQWALWCEQFDADPEDVKGIAMVPNGRLTKGRLTGGLPEYDTFPLTAEDMAFIENTGELPASLRKPLSASP